jgi:hypothetical protein
VDAAHPGSGTTAFHTACYFNQAELAMGGEVIFISSCFFYYGESPMKHTGVYESNFTAHG